MTRQLSTIRPQGRVTSTSTMSKRQRWILSCKDPRDDSESSGGMAHLGRGERVMSVRPIRGKGCLTDEQPSSYCLADGCNGSAHVGAPISLCAQHIHDVYSYAKEFVGIRWMDALNAELARGRPEPIQYPQPAKPSWVYFVRIGDLIKIGYSTHLEQRFRDLRPDEVLGVVSGTLQDERRCQAAFAHLQEHGEYFRPGADLLAFIADVASPPKRRPHRFRGVWTGPDRDKRTGHRQ